jgi:hypothetical protein
MGIHGSPLGREEIKRVTGLKIPEDGPQAALAATSDNDLPGLIIAKELRDAVHARLTP